jgi:hypothetical protein
MLMGSSWGFECARRDIHSPSPHSWVVVATTDAVAGATSARRAMGSAFIVQWPACVRISNLYDSPGSTPGTNSSHTPEAPMLRIEWPTPSHRLKSPTTRTARARGAHTVNETPRSAPTGESYTRWFAPSTVHSSSWRPSAMRCRSSSPIVGAYRYGSSAIHSLPSSYRARMR